MHLAGRVYGLNEFSSTGQLFATSGSTCKQDRTYMQEGVSHYLVSKLFFFVIKMNRMVNKIIITEQEIRKLWPFKEKYIAMLL